MQPPENLLPPLITGLAITGQTVNATTGVWIGTEPAYTYQWELCTAAGTSCGEIGGAEEASFTIPDGDAGHTLRVIVTAKNGAGTASATSEPSTEILGVGPSNSEPPTISGTATAGQLLTASQRQMERDGTDPLRIRMAALQHGRRRMHAGRGAARCCPSTRSPPPTSATSCASR